MIRGTRRPTTRADAVARAFVDLCAIPMPPPGAPSDAGNRPIAYRLETANGGKNPFAQNCGDWSYGDRTMTADCVGAVCFWLGIDRYQPDPNVFPEYGGWMNTDSIIEHAQALHWPPADLWRPVVGPLLPVRAGDVLVSPSTRKPLGGRVPGHIGLIVRPATRVSDILVIDCSPTHGKDTAIGLRGPWSKKCIVIRPTFLLDS